MNRDRQNHVLAQLEPRANKRWTPLWLQCLISIAISLKRLADRDTTVELKLPDDHSNLFHQVGNIAWEVGRNFQAGMRTDR